MKRIIRLFETFLLAFFCFVFLNLTAKADALTGKVVITGDPVVGNTLTATLVGSNYTGTLSYEWYFNNGIHVGMERYHQPYYKIIDSDVGKRICCIVKSSDQSGNIVSEIYTITGEQSSKPKLSGYVAEDGVHLTWSGNGQKVYVYRQVMNVDVSTPVCVNSGSALSNSGSWVAPLPPKGYLFHYFVRIDDIKSNEIEIDMRSGDGTTTDYTISITKQPLSVTASVGDSVSFTVNATGNIGTYCWQESSDGYNWTNCNVTTNTLSLSASTDKNGKKYRCVISNTNNSVTSDVATLTVNSRFAITTQPSNVWVNEGSQATFTVAASGSNMTYQWQKSTDSGRTWSNSDASGNKTATLTMKTQYSNNNMQLRCVVKDSTGASITSNAATLSVGMVYPYFTTQPSDASTTDGDAARFSVAVYGVDLSYQWQKSTDGGNTWSNCSATGATTANLSMNAAYTDDNAKVRCVVTAANGTKLTSNAATLAVSLAMPVVTSVSNTANGVEVKWNAVNGAAQYRVFYKTANGEWTGAGNTTGTSKVVTGLTSGTTYSFSVRCVSADGNTYTSSYDTTGKSIVYQPVITMVASPEITSLTNTSTGVQVKWNAVSGAAQYRVFYRIGSGAWTTVGSTTGTSKGVTGLTSGNTYTFLVRCLSADGKAYTSEYDVTKGKNITYIAQPAVSTVSNTSNGVEVRWNAIAGASQYRVFYKAENGAWTGFANTTGTSKVVTGLTSGTTYSFTVRCVSADGKTYTSTYDTTGKSIKYQPVAGTMYATPEILSLNNTTDGVEVKWDAIAGAAQYRIFYRVGSGAWTTVGATTETSKVVSGLTGGTTYTFLVRCLSADGKAYTSEYDATKGKSITYKPTTLATPVVSSLSNTATGVQVKWNAVAGASQYRVFYKAGNGSWVGYGNTTGTDMVVTGLTKGTTYSFTVRCLSADGKSYTSNYDTTGKAINVQ